MRKLEKDVGILERAIRGEKESETDGLQAKVKRLREEFDDLQVRTSQKILMWVKANSALLAVVASIVTAALLFLRN